MLPCVDIALYCLHGIVWIGLSCAGLDCVGMGGGGLAWLGLAWLGLAWLGLGQDEHISPALECVCAISSAINNCTQNPVAVYALWEGSMSKDTAQSSVQAVDVMGLIDSCTFCCKLVRFALKQPFLDKQRWPRIHFNKTRSDHVAVIA